MTIEDVRRALTATPPAVRAIVEGAAPEAMQFRESAEGWTPHDVLCHIADGEVSDWRPRVGLIMGDGDKRFTPFDRTSGHRRYGAWTVPALLDEFDRLRDDNLTYLASLNLDDERLKRTGIHPEFGTVTLDQLLSTWVVHDLAHINQLTRILLRHRRADVGPWTKYFRLLSEMQNA